jgi:HTH-type transcriptional repressor of NAD biosynthesis genes
LAFKLGVAMSNRVIRVALLGAESTGKTSLSQYITEALLAQGQMATYVPEVLREWCQMNGRTPALHEQRQIAQQQAERIFSIQEGWVIADTTPLMTAVYSDYVFQDLSLYDEALGLQAQFDLTLVMGLDVAWVPDGLQRDGEHVREPVDNLIRQAMAKSQLPFKVIYGQDEARLNAALLAISQGISNLNEPLDLKFSVPSLQPTQTQREASQYGLNQGKTAWRCDLCSDAECEHRLFSDLLK